jgi:hypothetical protein
VRLTPLATSVTIWHIVPAPDDRWWVWSSRQNENWQRKPKYSQKTCPSATLCTTNPAWPDLGSKPATNRLSYDTAICGVTTSARRVKGDGQNSSLSLCIFISFRVYSAPFPSHCRSYRYSCLHPQAVTCWLLPPTYLHSSVSVVLTFVKKNKFPTRGVLVLYSSP